MQHGLIPPDVLEWMEDFVSALITERRRAGLQYFVALDELGVFYGAM